MNQLEPAAWVTRIIATMIELAKCSKLHRIIVAGSNGPHQMFELHRLGYHRVATTATCGLLPCGQYDVAFVDWQLGSIKALETMLNWLVHFLAPTSVMVVRVDCSERTDQHKIRSVLERLGFRVEAGTRCKRGLAILARRLDANRQAIAA